jgi:hypothetical protein
MNTDSLRRGDIAQVRSAAEILATLDSKGMMEGLPFMPEMARLVGKRFAVVARGDKICDTIHYTGSRRLGNSVILDCARCDGGGHDGCQAECRIFWKEAWLQKVDGGQPATEPAADPGLEALLARITAVVQYSAQIDGKPESLWMCQNTEMFDATERLNTFDPRPYVNTYLNGDVPLGKFLRVAARAAVEEPLRALHLSTPFLLKGPATSTVSETLDLQPGEWVQVRSLEEIRETLTAEGRNGGMWFDREMAPYCGGTFRVRQRITRFIDEFRVRGKMVKMVKFPAVTLDGVVCTGTLCTRRWFCPREITLYWRECWLRRVDAPANPAPPAP